MKALLSFLFATLFLATISCSAQESAEQNEPLNILVFSKTNGFRHASISSGLKMLYDLSREQNWVITTTENPSLFGKDFLDNFDLAVFLNPTGDAIDDAGQDAFEKFMKSGKGFVGIHAAADHEYEWLFYGNLVGGYFKTHPPAQEATVVFENYDHPAMEPFKGMDTYTTFDEWYTFKRNPRPNVNVLATVDENSIKKSKNDDWKMGDHPIIWWHEDNGIRSFYTGFGHTHEAFQDELIIEHIKNAINWAGKRID
ncbi:Trehalose utilisation [Tangfeifania diversioriginum]|uniref:Trehalose utilisation n=1 Tax=Tangfeifania diversioriginum TaxID=1168035 RepID=A0A1M6ETY1_9BACT|nr:ThuA domain-containing protein [Tangfeifania diversioriginum]SHI88961.1 Trehalose utilisation [Tangfeifania diversioriginum]